MNPEDVELIDWLDHHTDDGWLRIDEVTNVPFLVRSVGWVLVENDTCLTLIQSGPADESGDVYNGSLTIIKAAITSRKKLGAIEAA